MKKALLYLFVFFFIQYFTVVGVTAVSTLIGGGNVDDVLGSLSGKGEFGIGTTAMILASAIYSVLLLALFLWRKWAVVSPAWLRTRQWDVLFWSAIASLGTLVPSMWIQELLPEMTDVSGAMIKEIISNQYGYFTICLFAPLVEELIFRGAILKSLLGSIRKPWVAIVLSAVIFAVAHANPAQMPHAFLISILLGWMYYRTGSILPGVVLHWVNNTVCYAVYIVFPQSEDMPLSQIFGGDMRVLYAVLCSLCILLPALYQLYLRMKKA
ncbi:MAG: type II CAAX endopeptidase family protein [Prevotellaceae bacterium]|nr:type II CAAX endopeptidase family protein [Prevotellaceae bacterium]